MRLMSRLLIPCSLLCLTLPAGADDERLPPAPTATPSFTYPAPMNSSSAPGASASETVTPSVTGSSNVPSYFSKWPPLGAPLGTRARKLASDRSLQNFQTSNYWAAPQPFYANGAPNYGAGLARDGGIHTRFPYYKYRAPWTYQGPAGMSHTIEW